MLMTESKFNLIQWYCLLQNEFSFFWI